MKINGRDTRTWGAVQLTVDLLPPDPGMSYRMEKGHLLPFVELEAEPLGQAKIGLYFRGTSRNDITRKISDVLGHLARPSELDLDGYKGTYYGILRKSTVRKTRSPNRYRLDLEFDGYMHDTPVAVKMPKGATEGTVHRVGSRKMPCTLILMPEVDIPKAEIRGMGKHPITVENMTAGHTVIIDGKTGQITQDGADKAPDVTIWAMPAIKEPEAKLTWSPADLSVTVQYVPGWL